MLIETVLPLSMLGVLLGFLASFLGVSGGTIMVPILGIIFLHQGIEPDIAQRMALGTSLAINILVSGSSVLEHMRHGSMRWDRWRLMCIFVIAGSICGSQLASIIPAMALKFLYATFVCSMSYTMFNLPRPRVLPRPMLVLPLGAFLIGVVSGLVGVAGSLVCVVFLACTGLPWMSAVCTGTALGLPICASGVAGYIMAGQGVAGLPSYCLGYLNLLALFSVCVTGIVVSVIGVRLCYKTNFPVDFLRKCYSVLAPVLAVGNIFIR